MTQLSDFAKRMTEMGKRVSEGSAKLVRETAVAVDTSVVTSTPVLTGRARSNWLVGVGAAPTNVIETHGANAAQASINAAQQVIKTYTYLNTGASIYITNNLPYIDGLNNGRAKFMPAMFVERAVQAGINHVRNSKILVERENNG